MKKCLSISSIIALYPKIYYGIVFSYDFEVLLRIEDKNEKYVQVRMMDKIKSINENHIDSATGEMRGRESVNVDKIKELLNYQDEAGNLMIDEAIEKNVQSEKIIDKTIKL